MTNLASGVPSLGTNLDPGRYWLTNFPYIDLMHHATAWLPQSSSQFNTGATLDLDSGGWVKSLPAGTWAGVYPILHNPAGEDLAGQRYVVMYEGEGTFRGAFSTISEASPGRFVLTSAADGTLGFQITSTDPADYVRNVHVVREDQLAYVEAGIDFNPEFLDKVDDFHTLRFVHWMEHNKISDASGVVPWPDSIHAAQLEWADRPLMTDAQWWNSGAPVEAMVEMCNLAGADAWFNMPVNASDDYVRQFATYVRDHLNPGLEIHIEFSNEVWNFAFPQAHYANAHDAGFANWMEWYGVRAAQIGRIWNEVFGESPTGGEDATGRVHVVYNTQLAWQGLEVYGLETRNWYENGVHVRASDYFDEYAVTGYYNFDTVDHNVVRSWWNDPDGGFDAAVASLRRYVDGYLKSAYAYHHGKAAERGLELTTYESGYAEVALNETAEYQQFLIEVQRQPALYDIELANYRNFKDAGGGLYMNFGLVGAPSSYGSWAALESLYQDTSPRYRALTDWNATVAPWYESGRDPSVFDSSWMLHHQNRAPTITSDGGGATAAASIAENTLAVTTVTATDRDVVQTLEYSIEGGLDASKFTISASTGALSFITAPKFETPTDIGTNNVYDVIVQASDGHGGIDSQALAVSVQNTAVQNAPEAEADVYAATIGSDLAVTAAGVLGNDFDADGDALTAKLVSGPVHGSVTLNDDGSFSYTPNDDILGDVVDYFTYVANDGRADSVAATVAVNVGIGAKTYDDLAGNAAPGLYSLGANTVTSTSLGRQTIAGIDNVIAGLGNDTIVGNGNGGILNGNAGNDAIRGGGGNDVLIGGGGYDRLTTGLGDDVLVFRPGFGKDTVTDFNVGNADHHDTLDLRGLGFVDLRAVFDHTDAGPSAVIHAGMDSITLLGVTKATLMANEYDIVI